MTINNLVFRGPYFYDKKFNQTFACVYAIVNNKQLIYVGITDDINERMSNHHKKDCWKKYASNTEILYIYKEDSDYRRALIEEEIIQKYNPLCNECL